MYTILYLYVPVPACLSVTVCKVTVTEQLRQGHSVTILHLDESVVVFGHLVCFMNAGPRVPFRTTCDTQWGQ